MDNKDNLKKKFENKEKPKIDKKRVSLYVKKVLWDDVEEVAMKYKTSVSDAAEELIEEGLEQLKIQEQTKSEDNTKE